LSKISATNNPEYT